MSVEKQKAIAEEVLKKLETFDPTCILAGGAPRDWYFGNDANDLDFYVYFRPDFFAQKWRYNKILESVGLKFNQKGIGEFPENYKKNPHLIAVYDGKYKGEKIQIMFMNKKTFDCVVNLFPFGICQAWWKGSKFYYDGSDIHTTRYFDESVKHKILRLVNDLYSNEDGYIQKIRDRFPDYLFIGRQ